MAILDSLANRFCNDLANGYPNRANKFGLENAYRSEWPYNNNLFAPQLRECFLYAPLHGGSVDRLTQRVGHSYMSMNPAPWNSLEIAKLVAGLLTPAALAALGIYIHRVTKRFEHLQWRSQKLIETRLRIYEDLAPQLNDLLCYFSYLGCWKDLDPPTVVSLKRTIDKKIYLAAPLFSQSFFSACMEFQNLCFETYSGWGRDALLRTNFKRRQEARPTNWKPEWNECFSQTASDPKAIGLAYKRVMEAFATDIGVHSSFVVPRSGIIPANIE